MILNFLLQGQDFSMFNPYRQTIKNNRGLALVEILASLLIITFVSTGLFVSIEYAQHRSVVNYHRRVAILLAEGKLNEKRFYYQQYKNFGNLLPMIVTLEERGVRSLRGDLSYQILPAIDNSIGKTYTQFIVTVKWKEPAPLFVPLKFKKKEIMSVTLREDYF